MTEKQTQPSAIAQAAAREYTDLLIKNFKNDAGVEMTFDIEAVSGLAALIDKHIAPLREDLESSLRIGKAAGNLANQYLQEKGLAEAKLRSQAEEIERLKKQLEGK